MKKAQANVSGFIILIGILIVLYVLLMNPCEKCLLLDTECPDRCEESIDETILLLENPGEVGYSDEIIHELDPINLYIKSEPESEHLANYLKISKGLFSDVDQELTFTMDNFDDLKSVYLSFFVSDSQGRLFIHLNGHQVFFGKITRGETKNIELPISYLKEVNKLELMVESPGLLFWKKNFYDLKDVEIDKEFEMIQSSGERSFVIGSNEKSSLDDVNLEYSLYCSSLEDEANLKVYLNNHLVSSEIISQCRETEESLEIDLDFVRTGKNLLKFLIDDGNFLISDIEFISYTDESILPSYSFDVGSKIGKNFKLGLVLSDPGELKEGEIYINDDVFEFSTYNRISEFNINKFIKSGTNNIEIGLTDSFEIEELTIWYE